MTQDPLWEVRAALPLILMLPAVGTELKGDITRNKPRWDWDFVPCRKAFIGQRSWETGKCRVGRPQVPSQNTHKGHVSGPSHLKIWQILLIHLHTVESSREWGCCVTQTGSPVGVAAGLPSCGLDAGLVQAPLLYPCTGALQPGTGLWGVRGDLVTCCSGSSHWETCFLKCILTSRKMGFLWEYKWSLGLLSRFEGKVSIYCSTKTPKLVTSLGNSTIKGASGENSSLERGMPCTVQCDECADVVAVYFSP